MDSRPLYALTLVHLPDGGYIVQDAYMGGGSMSLQYFACTTLDEALDFVRAKISPTGPSTVAEVPAC